MPGRYRRSVAVAFPFGATRQDPFSSVPRSEAKHAAESKRGMHSQSMDPSIPTRAAVCRSPIIP